MLLSEDQLNNTIHAMERAILSKVSELCELGTLPPSLHYLQCSLNDNKEKLYKMKDDTSYKN